MAVKRHLQRADFTSAVGEQRRRLKQVCKFLLAEQIEGTPDKAFQRGTCMYHSKEAKTLKWESRAGFCGLAGAYLATPTK